MAERETAVQTFKTCWELYKCRPGEYNRARLEGAAAAVLGACFFGTFPLIAPVLAALSIVGRGWRHRIGFTVLLWLSRSVVWRGRPMWNDYEMGRALLSGCELGALYLQVHSGRRPLTDPEAKPDSDANMVWLTGHWMLESVARSEPGFTQRLAQFLDMERPAWCDECRRIAAGGSGPCLCCGGRKAAPGSSDGCSVCGGSGRMPDECADAVSWGVTGRR
jgi:hypothetical protein